MGYFFLPHRFRWFWLLSASCYFYMAFVPKYLLILAATIVIDYIAGIYIEKSEGKKRKLFLTLSIIANVSFLAFFKYFNFLADNINQLASLIHWNYPVPLLNIILPIGLSFHTFQAMSYTIEVYRGKQKAERHFGIYALYVMFYPQLVAGPIERPQQLLFQFHEKHNFDAGKATEGLRRMLFGLFKKIFIADRMALLVNTVFGSVTNYHGFTLIGATLFFAVQLYCDFSGYSDIAVGSAKVMGFNLMENFQMPYFSKSIAEFWRRWHISLMNWFRDYLYYPLLFSGRQRGKIWIYFSLLFTFFISGLWHGADWKYVFMGLLNGFYITFSQVSASARQYLVKLFYLDRLPAFYNFLRIITTFTLVCFGWVLFRANNLSDAWYIWTHMFVGLGGQLAWLFGLLKAKVGIGVILAKLWPGIVSIDLIIGTVSVLAFGLYEIYHGFFGKIFHNSRIVRWTVYYVLILLILYFGVFDKTQFIYFQF